MTWFKVDDGFWSHPKTLMLSAEAIALWVRAGSYSCQHLTDGFIATSMLRMLGSDEAANELFESGLWESTAGGYLFHDWAEYQETSETVKSRRDQARERQRRSRAKREEHRSDSHATNGHVTPTVTQHVTRDVTREFSTPDPTRPDPTNKEGGRVNEVTHLRVEAPVDNPPPPSPYCSQHPNGTDKPCRGCQQVRLTVEAWTGSYDQKSRDAKAAAAERLSECLWCDDHGWQLGEDGVPLEPAQHCGHADELRVVAL